MFAAGGGRVIAREVTTGATAWSRSLGGGDIQGAVLLTAAGVVVVPVSHHTVGLDAASGRELWRYAAPLDTVDVGGSPNPGQVVLVHPAANASSVFIPAWGASVSALDLQSGDTLWTWQAGRTPSDTAEAGRFRSGAQGVAVRGDTVLVTAWHYLDRAGLRSEPWLVALRATTGEELWRVALPSYTGGVTLWGPPIVFGELAIVTGIGGHTWAVHRGTREIAWHFPAQPQHATTTSAELYGDVLYLDSGDNHVTALHAADGAQRWKAAIGGPVFHGLLATADRVYVPLGQTLTILEAATGRRLVTVRQPGRTIDSYIASAIVANGSQLFVTVDGAAWSFSER